MKWAHIQEGWRMLKRRHRVKKRGHHKYDGTAQQICKQIIEDCWNAEDQYYQTSTNHGHFCEFYMRDFGWAIESLLKLGHKTRVEKTLEYALKKYSAQKLTTTINPKGKCIDIFQYSPDSLAYLIRCLTLVDRSDLVEAYETFLSKEVENCFRHCFDPKISLIRADKHFGSMKDSTNRNCSTYDNTMLAMLSVDLDHLGLPNPFDQFDIKTAMLENLWNEEQGYWYDDIHRYPVVTGDNNVFPYWTRVFTSREMMETSIQNIQKAQLDMPFPLKYSPGTYGKQHFWRKWLVSDYQTNSIKTHMGALYIHIVKEVYPSLAESYRETYRRKIEEFGTYFENFDEEGNPLMSHFYIADEGNLWCANFLTLF